MSGSLGGSVTVQFCKSGFAHYPGEFQAHVIAGQEMDLDEAIVRKLEADGWIMRTGKHVQAMSQVRTGGVPRPGRYGNLSRG